MRKVQLAVSAPVSFVFSGDLGGAHYCREEGRGYAIFAPMAALEADFFLFNGDQIYIDRTCPVQRPGGGRNVPGDWRALDHPAHDWTDRDQMQELYFRHGRYNRGELYRLEVHRPAAILPTCAWRRRPTAWRICTSTCVVRTERCAPARRSTWHRRQRARLGNP